MIEVKNIDKTFGDTQVLHDVCAEFESGRVNMVIGQSGQGKSVLTKVIVGLHEPERGGVFFDGRNFTEMSIYERKEIRQEIGFLFQGSALFDSMTVLENVMFPLNMYTNLSLEEKKERATKTLERVGIIDKGHLFPSETSGGMQKRIGIARAIVMNPKYLFADEPNSGLDPKTSIMIDNLIKELTLEYNMTTVVISHDMNSVIEIGDHIIFINEGKNWWQGSNKDILATDNPEILDFVYASKFMKNLKGKLS
jgi:phospholipid/cholesterol/gamma-HCH transport system ATP-binding protein